MLTEIYTKPSCPHCDTAKQILKDRNIQYKEYTVGVDGITKETIEQKIGNGTKVTTVPQIFLEGKYIGGCDALKKHYGI